MNFAAPIGAAVAALLMAACATVPAARPLPVSNAIDAEVQRLMASENVVGMAVAVIDNGQVVHVNSYGYANREESKQFELFATYITVNQFHPETFNVHDLVVGAGNDTSIDAIAIIVNGSIVSEYDQIEELAE